MSQTNDLRLVLRGSLCEGEVTEVQMQSFCREHRVFKQVDNCIEDIQNHVFKTGKISIFSTSVLAEESSSYKSLRQRCDEIPGEGLVHVTRSLAISANLGEGLVDLEGSEFDIFFIIQDRPLLVLTIVNDGMRAKDVIRYTSSVAKEAVAALRQYTDEHVCCAFGTIQESCLSDSKTFKDTMERSIEETTVFSTAASQSMPVKKYKNIARAFLSIMATSSFVTHEENVKWFLTLNQFKILTENIDQKNTTTNVYPGSGGKVLLLEVAKRLERYAPTIIISESNDIVSTAKDMDVCSDAVLLKNVLKRHQAFRNVVLHCFADNTPHDFILASKQERLWIFHPMKETQTYTPHQVEMPVMKDVIAKAELETAAEVPKTSYKTERSRTPSPKPFIDDFNRDIASLHNPLKNIIDSTENLISRGETLKYISTYAQRSTLKRLKQQGLVMIKGRSGSGKSSLGIRLLSEIQRGTGRVPIVVSSPYQWDLIPKDQRSIGKYVVMIDDMFGTSSFLQSRFDDWEKMFDMMWPSVECGHIFLVVTTRPEISKQCEKRLAKYTLFNKIEIISLDEGEYALRDCEKEKLIKQYCGTKLGTQDFEEITTAKTILGFPQSCHLYANTFMQEAQAMGVKFFTSPYKFLISNITDLREGDPLGYLVLLLVMLMGGCLEIALLKPLDMSVPFRNLVATLRQIVNLSMVPSKEQIRSKADSFCGIYLCGKEKEYRFQHQSVFESVFLSISQDHPEVCIGVCSSDILVKLVRTETTPKKEHEVVMYLPKKDYQILAARVTDLLLNDDVTILDHPCFNNIAFVKPLIEYWKNEKLQILVLKTYPESAKKSMDKLPFEYKAFLSYVILKGIGTIPKFLLLSKDSEIIKACNSLPLQEILSCAIFVSQTDWVEAIFARGVVPDENCFRALCAAHNESKFLIDQVFQRTKFHFENMMDLEQLLHMNIVLGKYHAVDLMIKKMEESQDEKHIYSHCIVKLFEALSGSQQKQASAIKDTDKIIRRLIETGCPVSYRNLVCIAATHRQDTALKICLQKDVDVNEKCQGAYPIHQACMFGGADCLLVLLNNGTNPDLKAFEVKKKKHKDYTTLYLAAKSHLESKEKVEHLLKHQKSKYIPKSNSTKRKKIDNSAEFVNETSHSGLTPLHSATKSGNCATVKVLLQAGAEINTKSECGDTPLHVSVKNNRNECVMCLVQNNAGVNVTDNAGSTPLHYAAENANVAIIKQLLKADTDINIKDKDGGTCLHRAIGCGDPDIIELLLDSGANINAINQNGETALHRAALVEDVTVLQLLCRKGALTTTKDHSGQCVGHKAAGSALDSLEKLEYLSRQHGIDLFAADNNGRSALFAAAQSGDIEVMEFLHEHGLKIAERDTNNNTILHAACEVPYVNTRMVDYLLDNGIEPDIKGVEGNTALHLNLMNQKVIANRLINDITVNTPNDRLIYPIHIAADTNQTDLLKLLLEHKANPNVTNYLQETPLNIVLEKRNKDSIKVLIQHHADPSMQGNKGKTAIHVAAQLHDVETLELLINRCEEPWKLDVLNRTPLHFAARRGRLDIVHCILENGADINAKDNKNRTALYMAVDKERTYILPLLLGYGADTSIQDSQGFTPLHLATIRHNLVIVHLLLSVGADPSVPDNVGRTALHTAVAQNQEKMILCLLHAHVDVNVQDKEGKTALHLATSLESTCLTNLLLKYGADPNLKDNDGRHCKDYGMKTDMQTACTSNVSGKRHMTTSSSQAALKLSQKVDAAECLKSQSDKKRKKIISLHSTLESKENEDRSVMTVLPSSKGKKRILSPAPVSHITLLSLRRAAKLLMRHITITHSLTHSQGRPVTRSFTKQTC